jgi:hypothetical protein
MYLFYSFDDFNLFFILINVTKKNGFKKAY